MTHRVFTVLTFDRDCMHTCFTCQTVIESLAINLFSCLGIRTCCSHSSTSFVLHPLNGFTIGLFSTRLCLNISKRITDCLPRQGVEPFPHKTPVLVSLFYSATLTKRIFLWALLSVRERIFFILSHVFLHRYLRCAVGSCCYQQCLL